MKIGIIFVILILFAFIKNREKLKTINEYFII